MIAALRFSEDQRFDEHKRGTIRTQSRNSTGFNIVKQSFVFFLNINTLQECCILLFFTF